MAQKTMVATVNADTKNRRVHVVVEHGAAQSYSRAVDPKARREFRRWVSENVVFGALREENVNYGAAYLRESEEKPLIEKRCLAVYEFSY